MNEYNESERLKKEKDQLWLLLKELTFQKAQCNDSNECKKIEERIEEIRKKYFYVSVDYKVSSEISDTIKKR